MGLFSRLFSSREEVPPLPPLSDPVLGELTWNADIECWAGEVIGTSPPVRFSMSTGTPQQYPSEEERVSLRDPYAGFPEIAKVAMAFLRGSGAYEGRGVDPGSFVVESLDSTHGGSYEVTFSDDNDTAIWRVRFANGKPVGVGFDD